MLSRLIAVAGIAAIPLVQAQAPLFGQCGGIGWSGATTCVSGAVCVASNAYYSQCVSSSTASRVTTSKTTTSTLSPGTTFATTTTKTSVPVTTTASAPSSLDTTSHCGQWDSVAAGPYSLILDQWGTSGATGSDCAALVSLSSSNVVAWTTSWSWSGGSGVKTFTNIQLNTGIGKQLSAIKSIQSTWNWSQNTASVSADVAYDLFTATTPTGSNVNEIMIWLANYNVGPISATYSSAGAPVPKVSNLVLGGYTWNLYYGSNGSNDVYSFLPVSGVITSFSADINLFLKYLTTNQGVLSTYYLKTAQAGTEATTGSNVVLTTTAYSIAVV